MQLSLDISNIKKTTNISISKDEVIERLEELKEQTREAINERSTIVYLKKVAVSLDKKI